MGEKRVSPIPKTRTTKPVDVSRRKGREYSLGFMWTPTSLNHIKEGQFTHAGGKLAMVRNVHVINNGENAGKVVVVYQKFSFRITERGKEYEWEGELFAIIGSSEHEIPTRGSLEPDGQIIFC